MNFGDKNKSIKALSRLLPLNLLRILPGRKKKETKRHFKLVKTQVKRMSNALAVKPSFTS